MKTIIVVDDNAVNRMLLRNMLNDDYEVIEAENGQVALDAIYKNKQKLSAVLMDIMMPVMNGYEALRKIRDDTELAHLPVIMVTGSEDEESRVKALSLGANDFILKPYNPDIIRHCLKNNIAMNENASLINAIQRDKLTGLYNREFFFEKAAELIGAKEPGYYVLSCYDIDNFKLVNDKLGAVEGDKLLKYIGRYLKKLNALYGGICGRISGDNFACVYPNRPDIIREMTESHENNLLPDDIHVSLRYSIGRCVVNDLSLPVSAIYDRAYIAKDSIKGKYDEHVAYFDDTMLESLVGEQQIVLEMDSALLERCFETWFQPQYNHATGALIGAEALVRWRHPQRGLIPPGIFIPVFERNGFIYELDKFVWDDTCRYLRKWLDEGRNPLPVSVNISRLDVFRDDFFDCITGLLQKYSLPVSLLRLEVTESAFAESSEQIISVVKRLIKFGFTVEIDDFGSGFSSLNTLKDVPAQIIKLDMKFLKSGDDSERGGNIIESIIRMAKWLGMSVIAEGVESVEQADYLLSVGCGYIQGYLYAKPMPAPDYEALCCGAGREEHLLTLETVENLNNNSFWDPKSMDTLIFNSYVGAACIFEYENGRFELLRVNSKFTEILGLNNVDIIDTLKLDWISCLSPEGVLYFRDIIEKSAETRDEYTGEYLFRNIPGCPAEIYLRSTMRVIATAGARMLVYCTSENITAQRRAEERERLATEQIRSMLDDMPGGYIKMSIGEDNTAKPVYINAGYQHLVGMSREAVKSAYADDFFRCIHPDDADTVKNCIKNLLAGSRPGSIRFRVMNGDGEYIWLSVTGRISEDIGGNKYINVYCTDVSEHIKEEETRQRLLDNMPCGAGVYVLNNGQIELIYQNKSYWELVGLNDASFPDPAPMSAIHQEDIPLVMRELGIAIQEGCDVHCDIRLRHLTRGYTPVHLAGRIVRESDGTFSIYVTFTPRDI